MVLILVAWLLIGVLIARMFRRSRPDLGMRWDEILAGEPSAASAPTAGRFAGWFLFGLACVTAALVGLELGRPYYFSQDDVLVGEMPSLLWQCRSLWEGILPEYNPYILLGAPALSEGCGGTYPGLLGSYAIARHVLGNEFAMMEIFAVLHILAGYISTYAASRRVGMGASAAAVGSISFVLSGSVLIMGRSWHAFLPLVVFLPLLVIAVTQLIRAPVSWRWWLGTGLVLGISYHAEFLQVWVYSLMFFALAIVWLVDMRRIPLRRAVAAVPAVLLGIAIAMPLLSVQMKLGSDMARPNGYGCGISDGLLAILLPYPLARAQHPNHWGSSDIQYMGHFYYFGTVMAALCVANVLGLLTGKVRRALLADHVWTVGACVALLLALGPDGGLWPVLGKLPLLGAINNHPFRMMPFVVLFSVLSGGVLLERLLARSQRRRAWEIGIAATVAVLMFYHVGMARPAFYAYGFQPYPRLPEELTTMLQSDRAQPAGRLLSWTTFRSPSPSYALAMPFDLPVVYGLPAFTGYDPVVECKPPYRFADGRLAQSPTEAARAYGIRWGVMHRACERPVYSQNPCMREVEAEVPCDATFRQIGFTRTHAVASQPDLAVKELEQIDPLAFPSGQPANPLPLKLHGGGIDVDVSGLKSRASVVANFLWYPEIKAFADGREIACKRDDWYRIVAEVPAATHTLALRYQAGWAAGFLKALVIASVSICGAVAVAIRRERV